MSDTTPTPTPHPAYVRCPKCGGEPPTLRAGTRTSPPYYVECPRCEAHGEILWGELTEREQDEYLAYLNTP